MSMPLVRSKDAVRDLPNAESLKRTLMVVSTRVESAQYFDERYTQLLVKAKKDKEFESLLFELHQFVHNVALQEGSPGSEWDGTEQVAAQQNFQQNKVAEEAQFLPFAGDREVLFAYHIDEQSNYTGIFATNSSEKDQDNANLEQRFNLWLTTQNKCKDAAGTIFETNDQKIILKDTNGDPIKADPVKMRELIEDKDEGFAHFIQEENSAIKIMMHHFTDEELQAAKEHDVAHEHEASMGSSSSY